MHHLTRTQRLPVGIDKAWDFFSSPSNLASITPPGMGFDILTPLPEKMYPGMIVSYRIKPLFKIPVTWITEIIHVEEPFHFIDTQLSGPYKVWLHQHFFREVREGIEMIDMVDYSLPAGQLGRIMHKVVVRKKIEAIFDYRYRILEEKFGKIL